MAGGIAGTIYVQLDGAYLPVAGEVTIGYGDSEVEVATGLSGPVGTIEKKAPEFIEIEVYTTVDLDLQKLHAVRNGNIIAHLHNGQKWSLVNATSTTRPEGKASDGTATLRYVTTVPKGLQRVA